VSANAQCFAEDICYPHHQLLDVLLESIIVEALESLSVVQLTLERVAGSGMLAEDVEPELVGPPVTVLAVVSACGMHIGCKSDVAVIPWCLQRRCWPHAWGISRVLLRRYPL
jgi:hypothetical protein